MLLELITGGLIHHATQHTSRSEDRAPLHDWSKVAHCESTDRWHIATPPFYGGLQITLSTWAAYGGLKFAPRPDLATEAQQTVVAERILDGQGNGAWPVCSVYLRSAA